MTGARYSGRYSVIFLIIALICVGIILAALKYVAPLYGPLAIGLFFSVLTPFAFLLARNLTRNDRIHAAEVFRTTFEGSLGSNIYFEFFERKYFPGIADGNTAETASRLSPRFPFPNMSGWLLLGVSIPFIIFTTAGILILLLPPQESARIISHSIGANATGNILRASKDYQNAMTIASLAFIGAYLYSVQMLFKTVVSYGSLGMAFLRAFAHMLFAVMLAVSIWVAAPDSGPFFEAAANVQNSIVSGNKATLRQAPEVALEAQAAPAKANRMLKFWFALALAIGFIPDYAFSWILQRIRLTVDRHYNKTARHAAVTPLTVIEGIDFAKSYRLGQAGIASVQNLAVANPIMLHVETPYCMLPIMDWTAQAQLCSAVGPERFLLLKKINMRTIFDIESAVLDASSPAGLKQIVGAVLLANEGSNANLLRDFGVRPLDMAHRDFDKALTSWVNIEVIEHLVRVIMDNLHIQRLRQLWRELEAALPPLNTEKMPRTGAKFTPAAAGSAQPNGGGRDGHFA